ncbi:MAG: S26 family signal peptidase, partial [Armatimonadota bacterium]
MARMIRPIHKSPRWVSYTALTALACLVAWMVSATRIAAVPSGSMEPTLMPGDLLLMRIDAYRHRKPARGD